MSDGISTAAPPAAAPGSVVEDSLFDARHAPTTIGVLALVSLLAYEALAVNTAMPVIAAALQATQWYPMAFSVTMAGALVGMVLGGLFSDRHGPARPLRQGLVCFVAGLLLAGLATGFGALLLGRLLQGLGSGLQAVALYAFVGRAYPARVHPRIFGLFAAAWVLPALVGPLITGWVVAVLGWRWVFLAVPLLALPCVGLLWPALRLDQQADGSGPHAPLLGRLRWALLASLCALLLPLATPVSPLLLLPLVAGLIGSTRALLPTGSLRLGRGLPAVIALRGLIAAAFASLEIYLPLLLQHRHGWTPTAAGAALAVGALTWSGGSQIQARWPSDWPVSALLCGGTALLGLGVVPLLAVATGAAPAWSLLAMAVSGLGIGLVFPRLSVLTLALAPADSQGAGASSLQLSDALVTAAVTAIGGVLFSHWIGPAPNLAFLVVLGIAVGLSALGILAGWRSCQPATERSVTVIASRTGQG